METKVIKIYEREVKETIDEIKVEKKVIKHKITEDSFINNKFFIKSFSNLPGLMSLSILDIINEKVSLSLKEFAPDKEKRLLDLSSTTVGQLREMVKVIDDLIADYEQT